MKKLLVIGASGLIGGHLLSVSHKQRQDVFGTYFSHPLPELLRLDIRDSQQVKSLVLDRKPDFIVLSAAQSNVDYVERHASEAYQTNVVGVTNVVEAAALTGTKVVFISTSYIFDGEAGPYSEESQPNPVCEYGEQKAIAENIVLSSSPSHLVVRTTVVYGTEPQRKNFVYRAIDTLRAGDFLYVPADQIGPPTYAPDIATAILALCRLDKSGVYNVVGPENISRFRFAHTIASLLGTNTELVVPVETRSLKQTARRPLSGGMTSGKLLRETGLDMRNHISGLAEMLAGERDKGNMMNRAAFLSFRADPDPFASLPVAIETEGIEKRDKSVPVKLSILMSVYHCTSQLRRSLECLARQDWKEFEVLICDGNPDLYTSRVREIVSEFDDLLSITYVRKERPSGGFYVDPTASFKHLFPLAKGDVFALMQPEVMLAPNAARTLYFSHYEEQLPGRKYKVGSALRDYSGPYMWAWVSLRILWLSEENLGTLNQIDWHRNFRGIFNIDGLMESTCGLSNKSNLEWYKSPQFPWWFVGSARKDCPLWKEWPTFSGYAAIDMYLLDYRRIRGLVDILPDDILGFHQEHHRIFAISPTREMERIERAVELLTEKPMVDFDNETY